MSSPRRRLRKLREWIGWQWKTRPWIFAMLILVMVAGASVAVFHRQVWDLAGKWKSKRLSKEAQEAAAAGEWEGAYEAALESVREGDDSIDSLRILFGAARKKNDPNTLGISRMLFVHPEASPADQTESLALALDVGDVTGATALAAQLPANASENLDLRYQLVRGLLASGNLTEAVRLAESEGTEARQAEFDLLVARGLAQYGDPRLRPAVLNRIARTLQHPDREPALETMRLIASLPNNWFPPRLAAAAVQRFEDDSGLEPSDRLALASFRLKLAPLTRELLITSVIADFRDEHLALLTGWLRQIGAVEQVVALTEPADHPQGLSVGVYHNRIGALDILGRYEVVEAELNEAPAGFPKVQLLAYQAAVTQRLGKEAESVVLWRSAFEAADFDSNQNWYYQIADIAGRSGNEDRQMEALARGIEHRLGIPPPTHLLEPLVAWLYRNGKTERLLGISARLLQREPGNPALINNYHYLRALHRQPAPNSLQILRDLVESYPEQPSYCGTLAFVLLRNGDPAGALTTLFELGSEPALFSESERAVYAAALAALGRGQEAQALAESTDWGVFPDVEARILRALSNPEQAAVPVQTEKHN